MEGVEVGHLLAAGGEHDRPAGDRADRQRRTATGVAVELGEHHAVEADPVEEGLRGDDRVLTDHRVDDEEHLVGLDGIADVGGLLHEGLVDTEATRGVNDDDVVELALRLLDRGAGDVDGVAAAVAGLGGEDGHADALTVDLELLDGVGALQVCRDQQRGLVLVLEPERELGREGRLAGTLEAGEHDHGGPGLGIAQAPGFAAEDRHELLVDDLDDLLRGVERAADLLAAGPLLHRRDELLDHRQGDVGLEQRDADLARGGVDVGLGEPALALEVLEGVGKAVGESGEHGVVSPRDRSRVSYDG